MAVGKEAWHMKLHVAWERARYAKDVVVIVGEVQGMM
jgi:hypothetical protein